MTGNNKGHGVQRTGRTRTSKGLDPQVQENIGESLKALYQQVADEPVPERFIELLRQLEEDKATSG